ncbi:hypothetical protein ADIARSV_3342 [Arcticibacter svalbardensis MN12-7]|uniref:Uncharacterized protein n=1 Tax=Arcticibacter svalbardensis MN12-7 TaxID=1150600 RepID=R9GP41_9SPHI|nr:hypothetical protein ADIARSV_3342 [Arcticibacter svalbardensis MN12-7]
MTFSWSILNLILIGFRFKGKQLTKLYAYFSLHYHVYPSLHQRI